MGPTSIEIQSLHTRAKLQPGPIIQLVVFIKRLSGYITTCLLGSYVVCTVFFFLVKCSIYYTKILIFLQKNTEKLITELQKLNLNTKQHTRTGARLRQEMKSKQRKMTKQTQTNETGTEQEGPTVATNPRERRPQTQMHGAYSFLETHSNSALLKRENQSKNIVGR